MLFDRIVEDALNFIRRLLWWRSGKETERPKPFRSMRTHSGEWGTISLVIGRDTPRSVRTWVYSPKRRDYSQSAKTNSLYTQDLHFYLDFLGPLPNVNTSGAFQERLERDALRRKGGKILTHRLLILKASHFLNANGFYDCELVFWGDYDFYLPGTVDPKTGAILVLDKLVSSCLRMDDPLGFTEAEWKQQVEAILDKLKWGKFGTASGQ
jgi:hypothetical protein